MLRIAKNPPLMYSIKYYTHHSTDTILVEVSDHILREIDAGLLVGGGGAYLLI